MRNPYRMNARPEPKLPIWRYVAGLALAIAVSVGITGCPALSPAQAPGLPPDASSAQVTADEVLQGLTDAWNVATSVCLNAESQSLLAAGSCAKVLLPAQKALLAAGQAIDAWNQGQSGNFPCAVADAVAGLVDVEGLLKEANVTIPTQIATGLSLAQGLEAFCPPEAGAPADAGAGG